MDSNENFARYEMAIGGLIVVPTLVDIAKKTMPSPNRDLGTILLDMVNTNIVSMLKPIPCSSNEY